MTSVPALITTADIYYSTELITKTYIKELERGSQNLLGNV